MPNGSGSVFFYDFHKRFRVEFYGVVSKYRAPAYPLTVYIAPPELCPAGIGLREVQSVVLNALHILCRHYMPQGIYAVMYRHFGIAARAGGEVYYHLVLVMKPRNADERGTIHKFVIEVEIFVARFIRFAGKRDMFERRTFVFKVFDLF